NQLVLGTQKFAVLSQGSRTTFQDFFSSPRPKGSVTPYAVSPCGSKSATDALIFPALSDPPVTPRCEFFKPAFRWIDSEGLVNWWMNSLTTFAPESGHEPSMNETFLTICCCNPSANVKEYVKAGSMSNS